MFFLFSRLLLNGVICTMQENFEIGEIFFDRVTSNDPENVIAWCLYAMFYEQTNQDQNADITFAKTIKLNQTIESLHEKEEEEQQKKVVVVKTIVKEKRPYIRRQEPPAQCRKEEVKQAPKKDFDPYPDEEEPIQTADESTDTQAIKKLERKVKRIEKVEKVIQDKPFDKIKAMQNMIF